MNWLREGFLEGNLPTYAQLQFLRNSKKYCKKWLCTKMKNCTKRKRNCTEINLQNIKGNILKFIKIIIIMIKKSIGLQVTILLGLAIGILTFLIRDFNTPSLFLNAYLNTAQPYLIVISILLFIPPIINLISQMTSDLDSEEYDEKPFYRWLRVTTHTCIILLSVLNLSWIGAFFVLQLVNVNVVWLSLSIVVLTLYSILLIVGKIIKKKYKIIWYDPLMWLKHSS